MMLRRLLIPVFGGLALGLVLSGCGTSPAPAPEKHTDTGKGSYLLGQPYQINGTWYYPADDFAYDETGIASVYGDDGKKLTANGEIFDQNVASAGHRTLALPMIVQVTNLDNGRSTQLRINDRGPSAPNRLLQVSRRAALLLGFDQSSSAKVRVRVLVTETIQAQSIAKQNGGSTAADDGAPPPAVPHGNVTEETLPPPGSGAAPQPVPPRPQPAPPPISAVPPVAPAPEAVSLVPVRSTQIFIQAGAYSSGSNAMKMQAKLAALGPVMVAGIRVNGMDVYRVRLGPIATIAEADQLLARAVGAGASDAKIVID